MENITTTVNNSETSALRKNKLPIIGFLLMLAGPITLYLAGLFQDWQGNFTDFSARAIMWTALVLPGIGAVIAIISLRPWKKTGSLGRALAIVTIVMCNPYFYFFYFFICIMAGSSLAGRVSHM